MQGYCGSSGSGARAMAEVANGGHEARMNKFGEILDRGYEPVMGVPKDMVAWAIFEAINEGYC
ncbi:zinc finger transcription factor [Colletotrichum asianum]